MPKDPHISAAYAAIRAGRAIPDHVAAALEARGFDILALSERIQNT